MGLTSWLATFRRRRTTPAAPAEPARWVPQPGQSPARFLYENNARDAADLLEQVKHRHSRGRGPGATPGTTQGARVIRATPPVGTPAAAGPPNTAPTCVARLEDGRPCPHLARAGARTCAIPAHRRQG